MKYDKDGVIISDSLNGLGTDIYKEYLSHALCLGGACKFEFNGNPFELHEGDCMIVRILRLKSFMSLPNSLSFVLPRVIME